MGGWFEQKPPCALCKPPCIACASALQALHRQVEASHCAQQKRHGAQNIWPPLPVLTEPHRTRAAPYTHAFVARTPGCACRV